MLQYLLYIVATILDAFLMFVVHGHILMIDTVLRWLTIVLLIPHVGQGHLYRPSQAFDLSPVRSKSHMIVLLSYIAFHLCVTSLELHHFALLLFPFRSEEHTSELQSRGHLVCRLLL